LAINERKRGRFGILQLTCRRNDFLEVGEAADRSRKSTLWGGGLSGKPNKPRAM